MREKVRIMDRFPLTILTAASAAVCMLVSFLGPFDWYVYSNEGLAVFFSIEACFILGLGFGEFLKPKSKRSLQRKSFVMTDFQSSILVLASCLSLACFFYLVSGFFDFYGADYEAGGAFHEFNEDGRGLLGRICTVLLQLGMASFLLYVPFADRSKRIRGALVILGFWTTAAYYALCGSRFPIVTSAIVFVVALICTRRKKTEKPRSLKKEYGNGLKFILVAALSVLLVVSVGAITMSRMNVSSRIPENHMEFVGGDSPLKKTYAELADVLGSLSNTMFSFADYVGESPFVFSYLYENHFPEHIYGGAHTFRSLSQLLSGAGFDVMPKESEVIAETRPNIAKYSGIGFSLMVDYGAYACFGVALLFGFAFGLASARRKGNGLCRGLFPCIVTMGVFSPIYFFTVGRLDYVCLFVFILFTIIAFLRAPSSVRPLKSPQNVFVKPVRRMRSMMIDR